MHPVSSAQGLGQLNAANFNVFKCCANKLKHLLSV